KSSPPLMAYAHYVDRPPEKIFFVVRGMQPANELISSVREAIWKYAPDTTIARVKTLDEQLSDSLATERLQTGMLTGTGGIGLLLAMVGIYGVLSYAVAGRKKEIGIRKALGAPNEKIYLLVLAQMAAPVLIGLSAGLAAGYLASYVVQSLHYGVKGFDFSVTVTVSALLLISAIAAGILPARRAILLDPVQTLRAE
ncbi:MAG TPA: FtsX-like permease family protein, partial [Pseudacidobacterium sp.]|nr:FtsX-like permease family protein [Pseudacidobacterium sp.]